MPTRSKVALVLTGAAATLAVMWLVTSLQSPAAAQATAPGEFPPYTARHTADGKPDFNGIWQAVTSANWDLEAHSAASGPYPELMGAWGAQPGGQSIVEGGVIPYRPEALARRKANFEQRVKPSVPGDGVEPPLGDPELKCWMPGVPRSMYMPYPFQIVQTPETILITHEFNGTTRLVRMNWPEETPVDNTFFMGWSRGRWEGETLVVETIGLLEDLEFSTGALHSPDFRVIERIRLSDENPDLLVNHLRMEDRLALAEPFEVIVTYRRDRDGSLIEFQCSENDRNPVDAQGATQFD
jgi:hypothetical protein